jgi:hypothetical protein
VGEFGVAFNSKEGSALLASAYCAPNTNNKTNAEIAKATINGVRKCGFENITAFLS